MEKWKTVDISEIIAVSGLKIVEIDNLFSK